MSSLSPDVAARIRAMPPQPLGELELAPLKDAMKKVVPIIPPDNEKFTRDSARLEATGELWRVMTTEGHRLVIVSHATPVAAFTCDIPRSRKGIILNRRQAVQESNVPRIVNTARRSFSH